LSTQQSIPAGGPIGIFDSGVGGLSIWREVTRALPDESVLYLADQAHVPYGPRSQGEIRDFCLEIAFYLRASGCKAIVVACNTASAVALKAIREEWPDMPIIGLEPAVKPAVALTRTGVVGVMATPATFQGRLYLATVGRHARGVRVINQVCPGLASLVEEGALHGEVADALLGDYLQPMLSAGADVIVLGCTHYPFVIDAIRRLAGPGVAVVDPAPAVARHLGQILRARGLLGGRGPAVHGFQTTGNPGVFDRQVLRLLGINVHSMGLAWTEEGALAAGV
jgi:glutamate racemase